jgi:hypothetical protein
MSSRDEKREISKMSEPNTLRAHYRMRSPASERLLVDDVLLKADEQSSAASGYVCSCEMTARSLTPFEKHILQWRKG